MKQFSKYYFIIDSDKIVFLKENVPKKTPQNQMSEILVNKYYLCVAYLNSLEPTKTPVLQSTGLSFL